MEQLKQKALDLAIADVAYKTAEVTLHQLFPGEPLAVKAALQYAYHGEPYALDQLGIAADAPDTEAKAIKAYNKRKARKAMIMLKVNYKNADHDAVTDCIADLLHHCHRIDRSPSKRVFERLSERKSGCDG